MKYECPLRTKYADQRNANEKSIVTYQWQKVFQKLTRVYIVGNGVRKGALSHTVFVDGKT